MTPKEATPDRVRAALRSEVVASAPEIARRLHLDPTGVERELLRGIEDGWAVDVSDPDRPSRGPTSARRFRFVKKKAE